MQITYADHKEQDCLEIEIISSQGWEMNLIKQ